MAVLAVAVLAAGCGAAGSEPAQVPAQVPAGAGDRLPALSVECSGLHLPC